jgi:hypothetical protein
VLRENICINVPCLSLYIYRDASSVSLKSRYNSVQPILDPMSCSSYWVLTSPSFSTLICSLEDRVWTLSSGKEALLLSVCVQYSILMDGVIREALDELELVLDLAALVGDLLLSAVTCQFYFVV